jgi:hypothetical protein
MHSLFEGDKFTFFCTGPGMAGRAGVHGFMMTAPAIFDPLFMGAVIEGYRFHKLIRRLP